MQKFCWRTSFVLNNVNDDDLQKKMYVRLLVEMAIRLVCIDL